VICVKKNECAADGNPSNGSFADRSIGLLADSLIVTELSSTPQQRYYWCLRIPPLGERGGAKKKGRQRTIAHLRAEREGEPPILVSLHRLINLLARQCQRATDALLSSTCANSSGILRVCIYDN
jgi:hypothetical protein